MLASRLGRTLDAYSRASMHRHSEITSVAGTRSEQSETAIVSLSLSCGFAFPLTEQPEIVQQKGSSPRERVQH
ncbi:hypothetical protein EVAR_47516_1 [Eumeta japonica]|uniref:Uncharacterized protein n=1 Tax=Eumeta variegata TaxID=151549 RepID=A0A4C1XQ09_EUMVA|nr:hypothetical protein EVAR_47516_1 [Eumeta japonica]